MSEEDDILTLRSDLHGLMEGSGCPAVGLIELALACTSDYGVTTLDLLWRAETLDEHGYCHDNLGFPTELRPSVSEEWAWVCGFVQGRAIHDEDWAKLLPLFSRKMSDTSGFAAPSGHRHRKLEIPLSIRFMIETGHVSDVRRHLACFYLFLKHFGYGYDTLAQLLRAVQYVRREAFLLLRITCKQEGRIPSIRSRSRGACAGSSRTIQEGRTKYRKKSFSICLGPANLKLQSFWVTRPDFTGAFQEVPTHSQTSAKPIRHFFKSIARHVCDTSAM